ncbi:hypothetical protein CFN78_07915 [Amycolatopsis antarctica]|uniref:TIR domain-containing protein n=1 Tax=Amycolatopsis antarctica TaxID=1854586 RepID=A0A263D520_9PSEU|nr:toll/interleukin-1 receptor domain-containing protein [Amycolatopsis antarctica]OZM73471.1 hypothetical protein CFN78_07915 [Amycolatopsis antarctica]
MTWDVFVSYSRECEGMVARITDGLRAAGLRTFRDADGIAVFDSISGTALDALRDSKLLLAYYSAGYPARMACRHEFMTAFAAGQAEGRPLARIVAINPEPSVDHVEPVQLRDMLLPSPPATAQAIGRLAVAIAERAATLRTPIGSPPSAAPVTQGRFTGRWRELWAIHSALHAHRSPLTAPPAPPVAVVHGTAGIGKTALVTEYVRRFGTAFPGGVTWADPGAVPVDRPPGDKLLVLDGIERPVDETRKLLPSDPATAVLLTTRDPRLKDLGTGIELSDLAVDEVLPELMARIGPGEQTASARAVHQATIGSPGLRERVTRLAGIVGVDAALNRLHEAPHDLLQPITERVRPSFERLSPTGTDALRSLTAARPATLSQRQVRAITGLVDGDEHPPADDDTSKALADLRHNGVIPDPGSLDGFGVTPAIALAFRCWDSNPARTERLRAATLRTLTEQPKPPRSEPSLSDRDARTEEERRAAHRIQVEILNRVTGHPLPSQQGSLREALASLHMLLRIIRRTHGGVHPASARLSTPVRPGLGTIAHTLANDLLRQTLTRWHPELTAHEDLRPASVSRLEHERAWEHHDHVRQELALLGATVTEYAAELGVISGNAIGLD